MFELVTDVPSYPQFLPGCSAAAQVLSVDGNIQTASLQVSKAGISKTFTTRNTLIPFERLGYADWSTALLNIYVAAGSLFHLSDEACKVVLALEFEFSSKLVEFAFGKIFNELTMSMVQAFTQRAKQVYGEQHG